MEGIYFPEREVLICDEVLHLPKTKDEGRRTHCFAHARGKPRGAGAGSSALVRLLSPCPCELFCILTFCSHTANEDNLSGRARVRIKCYNR